MQRLIRSLLGSALILLLAASSAFAATVVTVNFANAPTGTHFVGDARPSCTVSSLVVSCSSYELAGVGNTDATAALSTTYSATIDCENHGGQIVEVHQESATVASSTGALHPKNGRLVVPSLSSAPAPTAAQFEAMASCPNPNWTAVAVQGSITLSSFTYKLTFVGFTAPAITITGP
jgi:hypothetical protein